MFEAIVEAYRWFFLRLADVVGLGWGIVVLSVICSALMIPLMRLVAGIVKRETEYQGVILPQLEEIKRKYASDMERHAHIQRLYRRYGYSPLSAVKKVMPLFVQIPFLLLTYFMLKGTVQLNGVPFLFLRDLGQPDGLIAVLGINVLPLVMTGVNILTVFATPGFTSRDWTQAIGISILFLVMLYTAPSALLLYWTLNNVITMFRTLAIKQGEGVKLLWTRVLALRMLPALIRARSSDRNLSFVGLSFLIVALYMRLMVYMDVWYFNRFASYWLMNEVLAFALVIGAFVRRKDITMVRLFAIFGAIISSVVAVVVFASLALFPITPRLMMGITGHCDLAKIFDCLFILGMVPVFISVFRDSRVVLQAVSKGFKESGHWLLGVAILSVHYSFASQNFKLPFNSVTLLMCYLLMPTICLSLLCVFTACRHVDSVTLVKIGIGVSLGAYLIPMISIEEGTLLGYGSNLVLRFALMGVMAYMLVKIKRRKPVLAFLSVLCILVIANAIISMRFTTEEIESKIEATRGSEARQALLGASCIRTNSIYLLVYDGYTPDIILKGMKIKSIGVGGYLKKYGFTSYDAYTVGDGTVESMGNTFYVGGVVQGSLRSSMTGNNVFCDYLRRFGYKTSYVLCGYHMPNRGERMPGNFYFPTAQKVTRPEMVLYPCIIRGILSQSANTFNSYTEEEWVSVKRNLIAAAPSGGSFIYAHTEKPGHVVASPAYRKSPDEERRLYETRVAEADTALVQDVEMVLAKNDDAIVIVASDHGSFLTLPERDNEYDAFTILDRVGVQLHVRWPHDYIPCLKLDCLQNLFLEIEIYLSGDKSLARFAVPGETCRIQAPLRAPAGTIRNAVIQSGVDKGRNLFDAARDRAASR